MKLILINGQSGVGKSSVGNTLMRKLDSSAYIDIDSLVSTNPWEFGAKTDDLAIKNTVSLVNNFSEAWFENIIISGLARNQELLDGFLSHFKKEAYVLFVWLSADKEARTIRREKRNRDGADKKEHLDFLDELVPEITSVKLENGNSIFIDTSRNTIDEIVQKVLDFVISS